MIEINKQVFIRADLVATESVYRVQNPALVAGFSESVRLEKYETTVLDVRRIDPAFPNSLALQYQIRPYIIGDDGLGVGSVGQRFELAFAPVTPFNPSQSEPEIEIVVLVRAIFYAV